MNRPENFNDLPVVERTKIIQQEITKIEEGKTHNAHTVKRIRNRRTDLDDFNDFLDDPEVANFKIQHFKERYLFLKNS